MFNLAQMHAHGFGLPASCSLATAHMKNVAERGVWGTNLGEAHRLFLEGRYESALFLYARLAEEGYEVGESNAAWMFDQRYGYAWSNYRSFAYRYYKRASQQGNVDAHRNLGDYFYYGWVPAAAARSLLTIAAKPQEPLKAAAPSQTAVPVQTSAADGAVKSDESQGDGVKPQSTAADKAESAQPIPALPAVVTVTFNATHVVQDFEMAAQHYLLAADKNNAQSMFNLGYVQCVA
mgnify:CR=1 FL=1